MKLNFGSSKMSRFTDPKLFVCYISGMNLRRIDPAWTPFTSKMFERYPWTRFLNLPSNELFPTLLTGADLTVHGVWGVKLGRSRPPSRCFLTCTRGCAGLLDRTGTRSDQRARARGGAMIPPADADLAICACDGLPEQAVPKLS
jgi:hypothetical protein